MDDSAEELASAAGKCRQIKCTSCAQWQQNMVAFLANISGAISPFSLP